MIRGMAAILDPMNRGTAHPKDACTESLSQYCSLASACLRWTGRALMSPCPVRDNYIYSVILFRVLTWLRDVVSIWPIHDP